MSRKKTSIPDGVAREKAEAAIVADSKRRGRTFKPGDVVLAACFDNKEREATVISVHDTVTFGQYCIVRFTNIDLKITSERLTLSKELEKNQ